jgi:hypothetical protein
MNRIFTVLLAVVFTATLWSQAPQSFSYQAVVRNANNELVANKQVGMKISLLQTSESGTAVYVETHTPTTNANGLVSIAIGGGTKDPSSAAFTSVDWANGPYFVKTETDPAGGTSYSLTTTSQLLSVPYALYAANSQPGPKGETGAQGPIGLTGAQGTQGLKGDKGDTGTQGPIGLTGTQGPQGQAGATGTAGTNGADGLSAYQVWLNLGNTGTQTDFINSLNGPQGVQGLKGDKGETGTAGLQGQIVLFNPTTPPTNGMVVYKNFQNSQTTPLYDDGQIRLRLNLGSNKLYLTNVNKSLANIWSNAGSLSSSTGASMSMSIGNGYFQNFGTANIAMGSELNVYSNLSSSNNYVMTMYISSPDSPAYGLYVINIYFNNPTNSSTYSSMTVNYYKDPSANP